MMLINEEYLVKKIEEYCSRSRSDLEIFVSLAGNKNCWKYDEVDYEAFFSHFKGLIESLVLIDIYHEKFDRARFKNEEFHLRDHFDKVKKFLFYKLLGDK